jgi:hypothetical protein
MLEINTLPQVSECDCLLNAEDKEAPVCIGMREFVWNATKQGILFDNPTAPHAGLARSYPHHSHVLLVSLHRSQSGFRGSPLSRSTSAMLIIVTAVKAAVAQPSQRSAVQCSFWPGFGASFSSPPMPDSDALVPFSSLRLWGCPHVASLKLFSLFMGQRSDSQNSSLFRNLFTQHTIYKQTSQRDRISIAVARSPPLPPMATSINPIHLLLMRLHSTPTSSPSHIRILPMHRMQ